MLPFEKALELGKKKGVLIITDEGLAAFSAPYREFGRMIGIYRFRSRPNNETPAEAFQKIFKNPSFDFNPWNSKEGLRLAQYLFGEYRAPYVAEVWDHTLTLPYQVGYHRRSFRSGPLQKHLAVNISKCIGLIHSNEWGFGKMNFSEQAQFSGYFNRPTDAYILSVALSKGVDGLEETIDEILLGEDEIGQVSHGIIKALLLSENPAHWKKVEQLLLAAQRQEGLRQTILEALDETSIGALRYMIKVILDHDLMRFSSVVRSVDTWFGFGWEAPKKATIKRILELTLTYFEDKTAKKTALLGKDNLAIYVSLWVTAVYDVNKANHLAFKMAFTHSEKEKQLLAFYFIKETQRTDKKLIPHMLKTFGEDMDLDFWMLSNSPTLDFPDELFDRILARAETLPKNGKKVEGQVFAWKVYNITPYFFYNLLINTSNTSQLIKLSKDISLIPSDVRENYIRKIFPNQFRYSWYGHQQGAVTQLDIKPDDWKRTLARQAIVDRNSSVMFTGIELFKKMVLGKDDFEILETLLSRKGKDLRKAAIEILINQPEKQIKQSTHNLITAKKEPQRLAALEMLTILDEKDQYKPFVIEQIEAFKTRTKFSKNEQVLMDKFSKNATNFSFNNGFGVIDYDQLSPLMVPEIQFKSGKNFLKKLIGGKDKFRFDNLINTKKTVKAVNDLIALFEKNGDYEYQYQGYQGEIVTVVLSDTLTKTKRLATGFSPKEYLDALPLSQIWIDWYNEAGLNDFELFMAIHYANNFANPYGNYAKIIPFVKGYIPDLSNLNLQRTQSYYSINQKLKTILQALSMVYIDKYMLLKFKLDVIEDMLAQFPEELKESPFNKKQYYSTEVFWFNVIQDVGFQINEDELIENGQAKDFKKYWDITVYLLAQKLAHPAKVSDLKQVLKPIENQRHYNSSFFSLNIHNFHKGLINIDDIRLQSLYNDNLMKYLDDSNHLQFQRYTNLKNIPDALPPLKKNLLQVELERGDLNTEASRYINNFQLIQGADYLFQVIERMKNEIFERGYSYHQNSRKSNFSYILKHPVPLETDTQEAFVKRLKTAKIKPKRLMEVACYANQWAEWIGSYLKIDRLEDAVWWFHAHASEYMNAEKETIISRYSNIEKNQFARGAIDIDWFNKEYKKLGKANWKLLHDAAKYISDGNGHRQVKLYSAVMLGEIKITEAIKKVTEKRDKDYVRALGLIPLSKTIPAKDLLKRYNLLQTFLKESKQFGAQRQQSEKNAVEIALDNLSRNAGYPDRVRFSWAMEGQAVKKIMENAQLKIDNVVIELKINDLGKAIITVEKNGNKQKAIPAKYKKNKDLIALKANKGYLSRQYSRTRLSLENAMVREDVFSFLEISEIMKHPVVWAMLSKLVLFNINQRIAGFYDPKGLIDHTGKLQTLAPQDQLVIAHPTHLYQTVQWDLYQKYLFDQKLVQPFKQVFRALYLITKNEKEQSWRSERYQGHQIQPKKTIALLRARGWTVSHEEGLQKVFHKEGFMVTMYAMADWFSPSDIEAPTLEYVCFHSLKNHKPIVLAEIPEVIFSEVMRDVDLVVSVAHVGGVDPEASHSTIEMRAALAKESARLFKLTNVAVKERNILIKGKLGSYSIHLGSGIVNKNGLALHIIPIHSQHRGRMFLPFVEDDPKSAEIISKMKLLAQDDKIKDPTVLAQINKGV